MSQKTEIEISSADLHHYRLMSGMFPENVVGARYSEYCRMTTDHALLFRWSLTAGIAQLRLHLVHCWFDQLTNVTFLTIQCKKFTEPNINIVADAAVGSLDRSCKSYSEYSSG